MYEVVRKLSTIEYVPFDEILSFKTTNYIGIFNHEEYQWILFEIANNELYAYYLHNVSTLDELDDIVYKCCQEHIESVSTSGAYTFNIANY